MVTPQLPFEIPPFWTLFHPVSRPVGRAVPVLAPPPVAPPQHPPDPVVATVIHVAPEAVADPVSEDADIDTLSPRLRAVGNRRVLPFPLALPRLSPTRSRTPAAPGLVSASADHAEGDSLLSDGNG